MEAGLIRFRSYGAQITFETTLPLQEAIEATRPFRTLVCSPLTFVCINRLPEGPCLGFPYRDMEQVLGDGVI